MRRAERISVQAGTPAGPIDEWLKRPDKLITRAELWEILERYEAGRRLMERRNRWYRRFWRWLLVPLVGHKPPAIGAAAKIEAT